MMRLVIMIICGAITLAWVGFMAGVYVAYAV